MKLWGIWPHLCTKSSVHVTVCAVECWLNLHLLKVECQIERLSFLVQGEFSAHKSASALTLFWISSVNDLILNPLRLK